MISQSAGSLSEEQFLADFLERMKEKRVPGPWRYCHEGRSA